MPSHPVMPPAIPTHALSLASVSIAEAGTNGLVPGSMMLWITLSAPESEPSAAGSWWLFPTKLLLQTECLLCGSIARWQSLQQCTMSLHSTGVDKGIVIYERVGGLIGWFKCFNNWYLIWFWVPVDGHRVDLLASVPIWQSVYVWMPPKLPPLQIYTWL